MIAWSTLSNAADKSISTKHAISLLSIVLNKFKVIFIGSVVIFAFLCPDGTAPCGNDLLVISVIKGSLLSLL